MNELDKKNSHELAEHFFRNEYVKLVAVVSKYIGDHNINSAEDIVQETLLKAVEYWQLNGIPTNPTAWLYTTAKNKTFNYLKKDKTHRNHIISSKDQKLENFEMEFSEDIINDEQLRIMFSCCQVKVSKNTRISLILKILCGFSITEIANAFFTSTETINKRLVRGRKELKTSNLDLHSEALINKNLSTILKTIYLLFNEGYAPTQKDAITTNDLCLEAIRLATILSRSKVITDKSNVYSLLSLMYLNVSRFEARKSSDNSIVELEHQNRKLWNQNSINQGIHYLNKATEEEHLSSYLILAAISANHCTAKSFATTNWNKILELYDQLIIIENTPLVQLNRIIVLSKTSGNLLAIKELSLLKEKADLGTNYLYYSILSEFYKNENQTNNAIDSLKKAIQFSKNNRDIKLLQKKLKQLVPIS